MQIFDSGEVQLHYRVDGPEDGAPVVFANSLGTDLRLWDPILPLLAPGLRIIRFDKRGHGLSSCPPAPYSMGSMITDTERLLDHLNVRDCVFVGLSIGGMIAQGLAVKRLDMIRALVLSNTATKIGNRDIWAERIAAVEQGGIESLADAVMERWFSADFMESEPEECDKVRDMIRNTKVSGFCGCCRAIQGLDLTDRISAITVPTQMIVGEDDPGTPVAAHQVMHEKIAGSELVVIPNALHFSNVEQKDAFNDAYMGFLGKHS